MKIAVLSDTHIPIAAADLPESVYAGIKDADMILHAGDLVDIGLVEELSRIAPTKAVCGNMDSDKACAALPKKEVIKAGSVSIGLIHGWGAPSGLIELVKKQFTNVDVIVFGHSHQPLSMTEGGILFFNPGSPTDKIFAPYNSYGILDIEGSRVTPSIIKV